MRRFDLILGVSLAGFLNALFLSFEHILQIDLCLFGARCSPLWFSFWSEPLGIPLAFWGAGYFLTLMFLRVLSKRDSFFRGILKTTIIVGTIISSVLLSVQLSQWKGMCPFCLFSFFVMAILFAITLKKGNYSSAGKLLLSKYRVAFLVSLALLFAAVVGTLVKTDQDFVFRSIIPETQTLPSLLPKAIYLGNPKAPVVLTVFSDLQCPKCYLIHQLTESLLERYSGQLRVAVYLIPFESHPQSKEATLAVLSGLLRNRKQKFSSIFSKDSKKHTSKIEAKMVK